MLKLTKSEYIANQEFFNQPEIRQWFTSWIDELYLSRPDVHEVFVFLDPLKVSVDGRFQDVPQLRNSTFGIF